MPVLYALCLWLLYLFHGRSVICVCVHVYVGLSFFVSSEPGNVSFDIPAKQRSQECLMDLTRQNQVELVGQHFLPPPYLLCSSNEQSGIHTHHKLSMVQKSSVGETEVFRVQLDGHSSFCFLL